MKGEVYILAYGFMDFVCASCLGDCMNESESGLS